MKSRFNEKLPQRTNTPAYFRQSVGVGKTKKCHGIGTRVQTEPFSQRIKQRFVGSDDGKSDGTIRRDETVSGFRTDDIGRSVEQRITQSKLAIRSKPDLLQRGHDRITGFVSASVNGSHRIKPTPTSQGQKFHETFFGVI
jgi:hypothetical protein